MIEKTVVFGVIFSCLIRIIDSCLEQLGCMDEIEEELLSNQQIHGLMYIEISKLKKKLKMFGIRHCLK